MKNEDNGHLSKGVRDRCASARGWCAKLEEHSSGISAALYKFLAPFLGVFGLAARGESAPLRERAVFRQVKTTNRSHSGAIPSIWQRRAGGKEPFSKWSDFRHGLPGLDVRRLTLLDALRQRIARLLTAETLHLETLAGLSPARCRRDAALKALYRQLSAFRQVGLWNHGPVVPPGEMPREPRRLLAVASGVRRHLDSPDLRLAPGPTLGVRLMPNLRPIFVQAAAELAMALAEVEDVLEHSRVTREARDEARDDLDAHISAARSLHRALCDLKALDRPTP